MGRWLLALGALLLTVEAAEAQQVRQMLNGLRREGGVGAVEPSEKLEAAAMALAMDMSDNNFFDHTGTDGSDIGSRARTQGYDYCQIAENIARGQTSVAEVLGAWAGSPDHRANMLLPEVRDYGLVKAPGDIWVLVMGSDGC